MDFLRPILTAKNPTGIKAIAEIAMAAALMIDAVPGLKSNALVQYTDNELDTALYPINHIKIDARIRINERNFALSKGVLS